MNSTIKKNCNTKNIRRAFVLFVLITIAFSFPFATSSHAITITGSDEITTNSSSQYTATGCNGTVSWSITGVGASISSNGVLTSSSASCGAITLTARCSDGSIATKAARVTNAGQWVLLSDEWRSQCINDSRSCACANSALSVITEIRGKNKYTEVWASHCIYPNTPDHTCPQTQQCFTITYTTPPSPSCGQYFATCGGNSSLFGMFVYHQIIYEWKCPSCTNGQTISCYTGPAGTLNVGGECKAGVQTCVNGQWSACQGEVLPQAEICGDGKDNNCDGNVDEGCETCEVSVKVSPLAVWPQKTGGKTEADVIVTLSKPAPSEGCNINFNVEPVSYSGKHSHHNSDRPKGEITPNSISFSQGEIGAQSGKYKSSEVAGEEKIKAKVNDKDASETIIQVKVPGFFELGAGDGYVLIGQTNTHPENHYGTENALSSLLDIADAYLEKEKGTLRINDISLEWGGLFDIKANWSSPHKSHRLGKNVDVDDVTAEGKKVISSSLKKVAEKLGIKVTILDEGNHLHLTFP